MKTVLSIAAIAATAGAAYAAAPGDIAFTGFNSDNPDTFTFVTLRDFSAGESIEFTDHGVFSDGSFRATEGTSTFNFGSDTAAGTVISAPVGGMLFSASGDQITAFVGGTFIAQVDFNSTGFVTPTSSNTTDLAPGLTPGLTALDLGETDNGQYTGIREGLPGELLAAINNPANWTLSNNRIDNFDTTPFNVIPAPGAAAIAGFAGLAAVRRRRSA